jgi:hypothetical protein
MRTAIQLIEATIRELKITEAEKVEDVRYALEAWERAKSEMWAVQGKISELEYGLRKLRMPIVSSLEGMEALDDALERKGANK